MTTATSQPAPDAGAEQEPDAAALWAEFEQQDAHPVEDAPEPNPAPADAEAGKPATDFDKALTEDPPADADGPKPGAAAAPAAADPSAAAPNQPAPAVDDALWAGASEAQRAAYQAAQRAAQENDQRFRSERGRVASAERRLRELETELAALKSGAAKPKDPKKPGEPAADGEDPEIAAFRAEYPEVAKPVDKMLASLRNENQLLLQKLGKLDEKEAEEFYDAQEAALAAAHPDWDTVTAQPAFLDFVRKQPAYVQEAARRNGKGIVNWEEAADIIGRFKAHAGTASSTAPNPPPAPSGGTPASGLSDKRQKQLESAGAPRSKGTPRVVDAIPDDPKAAWDAFERMGL